MSACGQGHDGQCCCECSLHVPTIQTCTHNGGKGVCGGERTGWACLALHAADGGNALIEWRDHGSCEMWTAVEPGGGE